MPDTDEPQIRQKVQEIVQIFPAAHLLGNPYQHRRRSTRFPSGARHRPQRRVKSLSQCGSHPTVTLDEKEPRTSRIVFHEKKSEHQGPPVPGTSASGAVIGSDEHGNNTTGGCFLSSSLSRPIFMRTSLPFSSEENTGDTRGEGESIEVSRGTYRCHCVVCLPFTSSSSGARLKSTVLGASVARVDVQKEAAHGFGPLKDVLGTISAVYTDHEVRSRPPAHFFSLTNSSTGNLYRQE